MFRKISISCLALLLVVLVATGGTSASDKSKGAFKQKKVHLQNQAVSLIGTNLGNTNGYGGVKVYDFDEGRVIVYGAVFDCSVVIDTDFVAAGSGLDMACGTSVAGVTTGVTAFTSVQADIIPNVNVDPFTNTTTRFSTALAASAQFDGTTTAKDIYVNLLVDSGDIATNVTAYVTGDLWITYSPLGDFE